MSDFIELPDSAPRMGNGFTRWLGRTVLALFGWKIEGEAPDEKHLIIAAAPHTSNWDFVIGVAAILAVGVRASFMMKKSAFIGPWGWLAHKIGFIPVDRDNPKGIVEQMTDWLDSHEKVWIGVTPEGTRSRVTSWKSGFLRIAHAASVPVYLVGLDARTKTIVLDKAIETTGDHDQQAEEIRQYMMSKFTGINPKNQ